MKKIYLLLGMFVALCASCYDEDALSPTNDPEYLFELPQGDHDYDDKIVDWFENYGFYTLYEYGDKDLYWANDSWLQGDGDIAGLGGDIVYRAPDPEYVGELVDMLDKLFVSHYPGELLQYMPLRVFLCSCLWNLELDGVIYDDDGNFAGYSYAYNRIWFYEGYDNYIINGASAYMTDTLTRQDQLDFSLTLNSTFLTRLLENGKISIPEEFYSFSSYANESVYGLDLFAQGYVKQAEYSDRTVKENYQKADVLSYFELICQPLDYLENGELEEIGSYDSAPSLSGLFKRPEATVVKQKYDIVVKALEDLGIKVSDLQNPPVLSY